MALGVFVCLLSFALAGWQAWPAQVPNANDHEAQSEYLRSFAEFVDWPSARLGQAARRTINFCVLGRDPYGDLLDKAVLGHPVGERATVIVRGRSLQDLGQCDVLFISSSESRREAKIFKRLRNEDVLTVGDTDGFAARGGIIEFVVNQGRVSFLINVDAAQRAGLRIGASLLALATIIHDDPEKRGG